MTIKQAAMWLCQPGIVSMIHDPTTKKALSVAVKALTESEHGTNLASLGTDCISRQAAIDATWFEPSYTDPLNVLTEVRDRLKALPSAEPKRGKWILDRSGAYCCSKCMEPCAGYVMMKPRDKFCKMCGAKMEAAT